jgi:hypothetical protein
MPATVNGGGDQLARGAVKVQFHPAQVTKEKYDEATKDFDLEKFLGKSTGSNTEVSKESTVKPPRRNK